MSRTSKTLVRLGVPTLAAATMVAGIPAFLGVAMAAPVASVTFVPVDGTATAAAGSCQAYYLDAVPATAAASTVGETVNVILTNPAGSSTSDAAFCTLPQTDPANDTSVTPASGTVVSAGGPNGTTTATSTDQSRFVLGAPRTSGQALTAGATGQVVVGITRNEAGGPVVAQAYNDSNSNGTVDAAAGEVIFGSQNTTFSAGGVNGSNENQDAAETVEVLNTGQTNQTDATVDADTDAPIQNESRSFRVLVTNAAAAAGDELEGVTVNYTVSGANTVASTVFGTTNNDGIVSGTISLPTVGANTITFFVNQTAASGGTSSGPQAPGAGAAGEPQDTVTSTVAAAPAARTLVQTPLADGSTTAPYQTNPAINPRTDGDRTFRVVVDNGSGATGSTAGTPVRVTVTGGSGDETVNGTLSTVEVSTADYTTGAGDPSTTNTTNSFVDVVVNDPTPKSGEVLTITSVVRGQASASDADTLSYVAVAADARNIDLTPETATTTVNTARTFTATVIDGNGEPVFGVDVDFTETGPGAFRNGSSRVDNVTTGRDGKASVEVIALAGESGTQTITATQPGTVFTDDAAGDNNGTAQAGLRAGNVSDSSTNNIVSSEPTASPTASPTAAPTTPAPGNPGSATGTVKLTGSVSEDTIVPTEKGVVTITGTPNANIELFAYSRPSTDYRLVRQGSLGADGRIQFDILPGTNTRLFASYAGAEPNTLDSNSFVQNVATALSLTVVRNGSLDYTFQGRILPRRAGQLITLYRVDPTRGEVITSQVRTDNTGTWRIRRVFTGQGTFGFLARTGQNLTNVAGVSNDGQERPTAIYAGPQR